MAYIQTEVKSQLMGRSVPVCLYFPADSNLCGGQVRGVITLLHGYGEAGREWPMMTAACRYAMQNGYILICPSVDNSFYCDMAAGSPFYTWMTEELPAVLDEMFVIPREREKNFIAGDSMGGYGALRLALLHPDRYAACASFSGSLDMSLMLLGGKVPFLPAASRKVVRQLMVPIFGPGLRLPKHADLVHLCRQTAKLPKEAQPRIFLSCGRQDTAYHMVLLQNDRFRNKIAGLPLDFTYREWDGEHLWCVWDRALAEFIGFIQNDDFAEQAKQYWL